MSEFPVHVEAVKRSLSNIHLPEIDLSSLKRPSIELPDAIANAEMPKFEMPKFDVPTVNVGETVGQLATTLGLRSRPQRSRMPLAVGGLIVASVAGIVGFMVMTNDAVRARLMSAVDTIRDRIDTMRSGGGNDTTDFDADESVAFPAAELAPISAAPYTNGAPVDTAGYSAGLGSDTNDSASDEAGTPA